MSTDDFEFETNTASGGAEDIPEATGSESAAYDAAASADEPAPADTADIAAEGDDTAEDDDPTDFAAELENYLPTPENTDKLKKPFPSWLAGAIAALVTCALVLTAYTFLVFPSINPPAVISYMQGGQGGGAAENAGSPSAAIEKVMPAIVTVTGTSDYRSFFGISTQTSSGTGMIIAENGYILTSNSLVGSNGEATVKIGKESYTGKVVGQDAAKDIAIIKIEKEGLPAVTLGDSGSLKTGDPVIAIADILGEEIGLSVTRGIICGVNNGVSLSNGSTINLLQTDAASGSSGGCLLDYSGNVVGMLTGSISANTDRIVFAIPSNDILGVAESIINTGLAPSGLMIGIKGEDAEHGVTVESVVDDSPAQKAGIKKGDLILKADGNIVKSVSEINRIRDTHKKGDTIVLTIYREGEIMDISVTL